MFFVGLDAGSVAVKLVVLDKSGVKLEGRYERHYGHPVRVALRLLTEAKARYAESSLSITGSAGKTIARLLAITPVNEIVSHSYSIRKLYPHIGTIIELGGENSKLIILEGGGVKDFSLNSVCAAGTGSFLEQQAERLRLSLEQFSEFATRSKKPSRIAGRCSVFAKSDMVHLQQIATPVEDIVAGLCFAVARNFKGTVARGKELRLPVAFQGGVAAIKGMVRAFQEVFDLNELFVPPDFALMGALGAAFKDMDDGRSYDFDLKGLDSFLSSTKSSEPGHPPLISEDDDFIQRHLKVGQDTLLRGQTCEESGGQWILNQGLTNAKVKTYLGIDIGSISTNLAVIDEKGNLLAKRYLMTAGRPIEAVRQGLEEIYAEVGDGVEIMGLGTTGSGRYMIADYVGADIVKNEITAQATAAIFINQKVDTIFEIGGQDSKYISIKDEIIVDFEMNKACAAGTGSFLEEQADKLDICVEREFAECAFRSKNPCKLGERCTVFMENSLMASLHRGAEKNELLAGLAYSIVQNYINRVVAGKLIGENIFFQGGVAFNKSVVAAFEKYLGKKITVPPHHEVTGAIGMALIAMRYMKESGYPRSRFKGFDLSKRPYKISSFECKACSNTCEINRVKIYGEDGQLFYGGRCERYDLRQAQVINLPDLFSFREEVLWKAHNSYRENRGENGKRRGRIGLPNIFYFHNYLPYWSTFLWELGFEVVVSPRTNKEVVRRGVEDVLCEPCFPVKVAQGHIRSLTESAVDGLFIPSFMNFAQTDGAHGRGLACPYVQTIPYILKIANGDVKIISPVIDYSRGIRYLKKELGKAFNHYRIGQKEIHRAMTLADLAQEEFQNALRTKGQELLNKLNGKAPVLVIVGRAYNAFDSGMNLEIPKKLSNINALSIPMDLLPIDDPDMENPWPNMYWRSGQKILSAAKIIRDIPNLYAIYVGNFLCGPDSFILKYFKEEMRGKPFLHIEIDEHSGDAGVITRCEAFLDSIEQQNGVRHTASSIRPEKDKKPTTQNLSDATLHTSTDRRRTIYIPRMTDQAFALKAAFEYCGVHAEVLPESTSESAELGRKYVSGRECYPYLVTAGDMLKKVFSPDFKPEESAFFMPSGTGPCRFGQYNVAHKLLLEKCGVENVPIFAPNQDEQFYKDLGIVGGDFTMRAWQGIVAYGLLTKCLHETRPYEKTVGDSEKLYEIYRDRIYSALESKNGDIETLLENMRNDFLSIARRKEKRPLVGIVGEIFVRLHRFSNENLVRKIESLGGEAWLAPLEEWVHYLNAMAFKYALIKRDSPAIMNMITTRFFQRRIEHMYDKPFRGFLKTLKEPETSELLSKAAPYIRDSIEGEAILSVGKTISLIEGGASGIVNAIPFGCMPGTIVTAMMKAVTRDYGIPCISLCYDGTESPTTELQLEAFMEAVHRQAKIKTSTKRCESGEFSSISRFGIDDPMALQEVGPRSYFR